MVRCERSVLPIEGAYYASDSGVHRAIEKRGYKRDSAIEKLRHSQAETHKITTGETQLERQKAAKRPGRQAFEAWDKTAKDRDSNRVLKKIEQQEQDNPPYQTED